MKHKRNNGFTLTEMLLVLLIVSGLSMLVIPNVIRTKDTIDDKSCQAYIALVNSQIQHYALDHDKYPETLNELIEKEYIQSDKCPDGRELILDPTTGKEVMLKEDNEE